MYLYSAQYLHILQDSKRYLTNISISHGVEKYFPRLWGTGISDAIFFCVLWGGVSVGWCAFFVFGHRRVAC